MSENINETKRLYFGEFANDKLAILDADYKNALIKQMESQKEADHQKEQVLKLQGAKDYIRRLFREWALYEKETKVIRAVEQRNLDKVEEKPKSVVEKVKNKFKKKG